jgi:hypothetical protein
MKKGYIDWDMLGIMGLIILVILIVGGLIGGLIWLGNIGYQNKESTTVTVQEKWIKNYSKNSTYLISTEKGVYEISDLMFIGKFNSSDLYARLQVGKTYEITSTGYRNHFFSMYKNINSIKEITEDN